MNEMQPHGRRGSELTRTRRERQSRNLRTSRRVCVNGEVNHHMVQTLAEARLLHRQIMAQPVAIRMPFARGVRPMTSRRRIVIMIAARIRGERSSRPIASTLVVDIMPTTSKHRMDE